MNWKYLIIVWRNIKRNRLSSFINIAGLATGIATFMLTGIYVFNELSYDRFHNNRESIYEINIGDEFNICAPIAAWLQNKYPEIENIVRLDKEFGGGAATILKYSEENQQKSIDVTDIIYADSTFFDMFSFNLLLGDKKKALADPNSIVLTKSVSEKIFGTENPMGKTIKFFSKTRAIKLDLIITALIEDPPANSSIKYNGIISFATRYSNSPKLEEDWGNWGYQTYIKLNKNTKINDFKLKVIPSWLEIAKDKLLITEAFDVAEIGNYLKFIPLRDVPFFGNSKRQFIFLILVIGVIVITIAIVNFINLSIAKSSSRSIEIGIKKVYGSGRKDLVFQLLFESVALSFLSTFLALFIVGMVSPVFEKISGWKVSFGQEDYFYISAILLSGSLIIGLTAGLYPAIMLSSFNPLRTLKKETTSGNKGKFFKRFLMVFQFVISIALIICTIIITKQVRYLRTKDVGFDKENIIYTSARSKVYKNYDAFKQKLLQNPNIFKIASSNTSLAQNFPMTNSCVINDKERSFYTMTVDQDFVQTLGLKIIEGRDFSWDIRTDEYGAMIINETAVKEFELTQPIGTELEMFGHKVVIIGVMKDFHASSFHQKIPPSALWVAPWNGAINLRIDAINKDKSIEYIKKTWDEFSPDIPFEYHFLDDEYDSLYNSEKKFNLLIAYFSILAIFIACLGLFGLVSFSIEQRIKEIGIRKVNGARALEIVVLLNKSVIIPVLVAFIIACPVALYAMKEWLQNFSYRTEINIWIFLLAGLIALVIVICTVSLQSWKAATRNPVEALRNE
ncbi:MAG: ABC transporter permease [Bacteroidales bacterium]|nr:ABC transporter permease [Bacteroidales bacterium]